MQRDRKVFAGVLDIIRVQENLGRLHPDEEVGGTDGDVLGLLKSKVASARGPGGRTIPKRFAVNFHVPVTTGVRLRTPDGRTSFHFSQISVAKKRTPRPGAKPTNGKSTAAAHNKYIERDDAVATIDASDQLSAELAADIAATQNHHADEILRSAEQENARDDQPHAQPERSAADVRTSAFILGLYQSALEASDRAGEDQFLDSLQGLSSFDVDDARQHDDMLLHGTAESDFGVEPHLLRRARTCNRENERGHQPAQDLGPGNPDSGSPAGHGRYIERPAALALQPGGNRVLFTNISTDAAERQRTWQKIEELEDTPGPDKMVFQVNDHMFWNSVFNNPECPDLIKAAISGNLPVGQKFVINDGREARKWLASQLGWNHKCPQAKFADGQGGRTQYRIIGELPHELSFEDRVSILREFSEDFVERKFPFVAVMHAPDHKNDERNWHFHLVYYDRPSTRMDDGQWDFEAVEHFKDKHRHNRKRYPHRQAKCTAVSDDDWIPQLRSRLADITNSYLEAANIERRLDPRTHAKMGLLRAPQEHLGTNLSAMEGNGVATPRGAANAYKEWDELAGRAAKSRKLDDGQTHAQVRAWKGLLADIKQSSNGRLVALGLIDEWQLVREQAAEYRMMAETVEVHSKRTLSRAQKVIENHRVSGFEHEHVDTEPTKQSSPKRDALVAAASAHIELTEIAQKEQRTHAVDWSLRADNAVAAAIELETRIVLTLRPGRKQAQTSRETQAGFDFALIPSYRDVVQVIELPPQKPTARYLADTEIEAFMELLLSQRRRIERRKGTYVPALTSPSEEAIIGASNYTVISERLEIVKSEQDRQIDQVVDYIGECPASIIRNGPREVDVTFVPLRREMSETYQLYREDPDLKIAVAAALAWQDVVSSRTQPSVQQPAAPDSMATAVSAQPKQGNVVLAGQVTTPIATGPANSALARRDLNPVLDKLAGMPVRIEEASGRFKPTVEFCLTYGLTDAEINFRPVQARLRAMLKSQEDELARLEGYAKRRPDALSDTGACVKLDASVPEELQRIASKWQSDPLLQKRLRRIIVRDEQQRLQRSQIDTLIRQQRESEFKPHHVVSASAQSLNPKDTTGDEARSKQADTKPDMPHGAVPPLSGNSYPTFGVTDRIDQWFAAVGRKDSEAICRKLAGAVTSDRRSRDLLATLDPKIAAKIELQATEFRRSQVAANQMQMGRRPNGF